MSIELLNVGKVVDVVIVHGNSRKMPMHTCMACRRTLRMKACRRYRRRWGSNMSMNSPSPMLLLEAVASAAFCAQLAAVMLPSLRKTSHCNTGQGVMPQLCSASWPGGGASGTPGGGGEGDADTPAGCHAPVVFSFVAEGEGGWGEGRAGAGG